MSSIILLTLLLATSCLATNNEFKSPRTTIEPMVATTCSSISKKYLLQYTNNEQQFIPTETDGCIRDKLEILKQCQKLYPLKDITNIVESGKKLGNFCQLIGGEKKCAGQEDNVVSVVYRCLESPFQSDALLVPSPCIFDHIHNSSHCWDSSTWNSTAVESCSHRNFKLKSFAVLLPCGVGMFTGVEFVCCPVENVVANSEEYDDEEEDDDDDDYYFDEATTTTTTTPPSLDPYFSQPSTNEHLNYKQASLRLENLHRLRMSKVMRDWEELEKKYQQMKETDEGGAEVFKKSMTTRFQKTIKNLEDEGGAEKRQLVNVHQQRVLAHLSTRKKESLECFTASLNSQNPNRVRKCLEKLMRILHKDRHHTLAHWKHLVRSNLVAAEAEEEYTVLRLGQIGAMAREGVGMLGRHPTLSTKLLPLIEDYVLSLQGRDDPIGESILTATADSEKELLTRLKLEIVTTTTTTTMTTSTMETEPTTTMTTPIVEQIISVRRQVYSNNDNVFVIFGVAMLLGVVMILGYIYKRRYCSPRGQGFLEVNQQQCQQSLKSPEEKHVANMQINGYENPTYKYFEQN